MYKLGIDVGGTNTDAVLLDKHLNVIAHVKHPTSKDVYSGILDTIQEILKISNIDPSEITQAMLGTTQCTNAIVEQKNLAKIAILRIGAPATLGIPPMIDWNENIRKISYAEKIVAGGFEHDGREISSLDEESCRSFFEDIKGNVEAIAISSVFSTIRDDHEIRVAEIAKEVLDDSVHISLSSEIGSMGLIERENATILNAALFKVAQTFTHGFARSLAEEGIHNAQIYLSQNDGTLMTMDYALRYPILTIACGPTNSIRGASYLGSLQDAIVIDVGGTTTDIGVIQKGFPRESGIAVTIGGVRTNFRMPDVYSIGLGGGSIVRCHEDQRITVGPDSVGSEITSKALVFGGDVITATDIAVRLGLVDIGDKTKVQHMKLEFAQEVLKVIRTLVEDSIDTMKLSNNDMDVILVGGGSIILPEHLAGAARVVMPEHFEVANAIGSAISKVSGTYEKLVDYNEIPREHALEQAKLEAVQMAVRAGAVEETVEIIDVEDIPLAYHAGNTNRVKIKAVGDIS